MSRRIVIWCLGCVSFVIGPPASGLLAQLIRPDMLTTLPKRVQLQRSSQGYSAKLDVARAGVPGGEKYWLTLAVGGLADEEDSGGWLLANRLYVETGNETIALDVMPEHRRDEGLSALAAQPTEDIARNRIGEPLIRTYEERSFPVTAEQLLAMAAANSLTFRLVGSTGRSTEHTIKPKQRSKLAAGILRILD